MAQFSRARVALEGVVLSPSRLAEFKRRDGSTGRRFETDVVCAGPDGTDVVTVQSDGPVYERVESPQPFHAYVLIAMQRGERGTFVFVTLAAEQTPQNGKAPAPAQAARS